MAADFGKQVRLWSFRQAPHEFQGLFPGGRNTDWVAQVPGSEHPDVANGLLRWRPIYPVTAVTLADQSVVYWGAETEAMASLAKWGKPATGSPEGQERRSGARVQIECPSRYETQSEPKQVGIGHTIDLASGGICFTTESQLPKDIEATVLVKWPVPLEDAEAVELRAVGKLVRTEAMKAALQMKTLSFLMEGRWERGPSRSIARDAKPRMLR
jgi:hypothetical protein